MRIEKAAELRLEQLLEEGFGERIEPDHDGDYPLPTNGDFYARLEEREEADPIVQVFAVAVRDIHESPELFEALNRVNASLSFARAFWIIDQVLIETEVNALALKHPSLGTAVSAVGSAARYWAPRLTGAFGGRSLFVAEEPEDEDGPGQHL